MQRLFRRKGKKTWHVRYYDADGKRRSKSTKCRDKEAADIVARGIERDACDPNHARARDATLTSLLEDMILECAGDAKAGKLAPETVEFYRKRAGHLLRLQLEPIDGDGPPLPTMARSIEAHHVDAYITRRRAEGVGDNTISKELVTLRKALKLAKRRRRWRGDLDEIFPTGFSPAYKPRDRFLSVGQLQLLLRELAAKRAARVAFMVAVGADVRDADRAHRSDVAGDVVHLRGTKTATRDRLVPIVWPWQRELLRFALEHADGEGELLFSTWTKSCRDLAIACEAAKVPRVNNKDLRRTFATWLRAGGAMPSDIGLALGHATGRMAELVYAKVPVEVLAERLRAAAPPVHQRRSRSADLAHSADRKKHQNKRESGSSCWTRTSDPVINSCRLLLPKPRETRRIGAMPATVAPPVHQRKRAAGR